MKSKYCFFYMAIFAAAASFNTVYAQEIRDQKFQRHGGSGSFNTASYVPIEVKLKVDKKQPLSNDGIIFTVQWINHSGDSITLLNVVNLVGVIFFMDTSYLPVPISTAIKNSVGPWKMEERPFKIDAIFINNVKQYSDITTLKTTTIPPKSTYSANLRIAEVIKFDRSMLGHNPDPRSPRYKTPAGEYKVTFHVGVISERPTKIHIAESLDIPDVLVKYGVN